jgi:type I restriction enzyme S subunit
MKINHTQNNVPNGWQEIKLASIGSFSKGSGITKEQLSQTGHNAIRYGELYTKHHFHIRKIYSFISDEIAALSTKVKYGDILFAGSGETIDEIGKSAAYLLKEDAYAGGDTIIFRPKDANSLFLSYFLNIGEARKKLRELGQGQSVVHIYKSDIENLRLHLPPLHEQNRIVAVLEIWDRAVEKLTKIIKAKRGVKKWLMQELLTGKTRLPGFKDKWAISMFGDIATLRKERFDPKSKSAEKFCVELENIQSGTGRLIGETYTKNNSSLKSIFYPGDVLFGKLRAYLKKYWFATCEGVCSTEIWVLEAKNKKIIPEILFQIVQSEGFISTAAMTQGTHMPRSNWDVVAGYKIRLPDTIEQTAITKLLTTADQEIAELEKKLKLLEDQKKYLLNNLITGTIQTPKTLPIHN